VLSVYRPSSRITYRPVLFASVEDLYMALSMLYRRGGIARNSNLRLKDVSREHRLMCNLGCGWLLRQLVPTFFFASGSIAARY